ncbi:conserved hypothetical protein (putative transposase or invertase) [Alicyclobacillus vulcanalis]|uniref:Transposase/invertase (TIGR01784 family) n=1 Tax=Alicyclobacillus vulcanalis TaxID=252246 RepID=A0A1N7LIQ7_9BACL|nr:conserved hypothetical protein (putative transposase or invertase) [Alicyclobacillus vulcanalis]
MSSTSGPRIIALRTSFCDISTVIKRWTKSRNICVRDSGNPATVCGLGLALNMRLESQEKTFERVRELIPRVPDETERDLVVSAILVLGDQGLTEEQRAQLRKELRNVSKLAEELYEEGRQEGRIEGHMEIAMNMLRKGMKVGEIADITGLSRQEIEELARKSSH